MIPSLTGRIQTWVAMMATIGVVWSLLFAAVTPVGTTEVLQVLAFAALLGLGWEVLLDQIARRRWDEDFPSGTALAFGVVELIPVLIFARWRGYPLGYVAGHFLSLWVVVWLWLQGPMRVVAPRWRFRAGRLW